MWRTWTDTYIVSVMSALRWKLALLCVTCLGFTPALSAQKYAPKKITFSGVMESQAELLTVSGLKPGDPVGQAEIQAAAQKLIGTGMFSDVQFSFDGVDLNYALKPAATMEPVRYQQLSLVGHGESECRGGGEGAAVSWSVPPESAMQQAVATALTALLAEKGVRATVTGTPGQELGRQMRR